MQPPSDQQKEAAKTFLEKLFGTLEAMVNSAMSHNQYSNSESCRPLSDVKVDLKAVEACFTNEECPILEEAAEHLSRYRDNIRALIADRPQPSDSQESEAVYEEIMKFVE